MKASTSFLFAAAFAASAQAQFLQQFTDSENASPKTVGEIKIEAKHLSASRQTGTLSATGRVVATAAPYRIHTDAVHRDEHGHFSFAPGTMATTCSNNLDHLHWRLTGEFHYLENRAAIVKDAWLRLFDVPVLWVPYWYYPLNTDYGLRVLPGYTSKWGGYLLTGYVYDIWNEGKGEGASLGGSTYADFRTKNGFALGQTVRWNLADYGKGKFKVYHAWDLDEDRYSDHWHDRKHNYRNWGSDVDRERYGLKLEHYADLTERDTFRAQATYFSDSWFRRDFYRSDERGESIPVNEVSYEHRELEWAAGVSASGPVNDFYGGTARLPEGWFAVSPQPIWDLPVNYESQTRAGYLNRNYAEYRGASDDMFRYVPYIGPDGRSADYQAFRADTSHRVTIPFKLWDVLSVVPRATYHGTFWGDSGSRSAFADGRSKATGDGICRNIAEFGFTAAARGSAWINDRWRHTFEPYLDYSYQAVDTSSSSRRRAYVFDNYDGATEWLDQFGFEGRGLPFNWHGVRPGVRNTFRRADENGVPRTVFDADLYAAVPFDSYSRYGRDSWTRGYAKDNDDPHYSHDNDIVPGVRLRYAPTKNVTFLTRSEYDARNDKAAYSDIFMRHRVADNFSWHAGYIGRDHRNWDYVPSTYDRYNWAKSSIARVGFEHGLCDWLAWGPYMRYDCRRGEVDEIGTWVDLMTDCLAFRVQVEYENDFRRIDGSHHDDDVRVVFFIYLRAFGPHSMLDLARF